MIKANNVSKHFGPVKAVDQVSFEIGAGEIVGLIGPNGAGKSTLLKAIMGLVKYQGDLRIFGHEPFSNRTDLLKNMSYIADVASLPEWMKVNDLLVFMSQIHPKFSIDKAVSLLKDTPIIRTNPISSLSKGMKTRLHLIVILSIESALLVLDEPTLGLDVLVRRDFQDRLVQDYYTQQRSILITTHQIDEVQSILTRVLFIKQGRINLDIKTSELKSRYSKLISAENIVFADPKIKPVYQRQLPEHTEFIFTDVEHSQLEQYGEVVTPSLEDLFVVANS